MAGATTGTNSPVGPRSPPASSLRLPPQPSPSAISTPTRTWDQDALQKKVTPLAGGSRSTTHKLAPSSL
ncbi:hypothetical protein COCON_G00207050 [Conger conger]|uniref:Uncharacterized protein n=1 Tax=Conger conger TaxID=82655 RepID=A0A9Q1HQ18_CONCO|nr:hypothetical protein COCON_G00207050 [Conger conger]